VKKEKQLIRQREKRKSVNISRFAYSATLVLIFCAVFSMPVLAAAVPAAGPTVWDKALEIMQDVYKQILLISTIAAIVTAAVALLLMNFSKSGKTVDESRSWLKRIIITWVILNGLGFIMAYITPFFTGGQWTP
jgi:heme/copper-type cytochrome/quinol oxidase subunit 2